MCPGEFRTWKVNTMNLRAITLLTAIAQALACVFRGIGFVSFVYSFEFHGQQTDNILRFAYWPAGVVAQATLAFFLFYLFAKQKDD